MPENNKKSESSRVRRFKLFRTYGVSLSLIIFFAATLIVARHSDSKTRHAVHSLRKVLANEGQTFDASEMDELRRLLAMGNLNIKNLALDLNATAYLQLYLASNVSVENQELSTLERAFSHCHWAKVLRAAADLEISSEVQTQIWSLAQDESQAERARIFAAVLLASKCQSDSKLAAVIADLLTEIEVKFTTQEVRLIRAICTDHVRSALKEEANRAFEARQDFQEFCLELKSIAGASTLNFGLAVDVPVEQLDRFIDRLDELGMMATNVSTTIDSGNTWKASLTWRHSSERAILSKPLATKDLTSYLLELPPGYRVSSVAAWPYNPSEASERWRLLMEPTAFRVTHDLVFGEEEISAFIQEYGSHWNMPTQCMHPESMKVLSVIAEREPARFSTDVWSRKTPRFPIYRLGRWRCNRFSPVRLVNTGQNELSLTKASAELQLPATDSLYLSKMLPSELKQSRDWEGILDFLEGTRDVESGSSVLPPLQYLALRKLGRDAAANAVADSLQPGDFNLEAIRSIDALLAGEVDLATERLERLLGQQATENSYNVACWASLFCEFFSEDKIASRELLALAVHALEFLDEHYWFNVVYALCDPDLDAVWQSGWTPTHSTAFFHGHVQTGSATALGFVDSPRPVTQLANCMEKFAAMGFEPTFASPWPSREAEAYFVAGWYWREPDSSTRKNMFRWAKATSWGILLGDHPEPAGRFGEAEVLADAILQTGLHTFVSEIDLRNDLLVRAMKLLEPAGVQPEYPVLVPCEIFGSSPLLLEGSLKTGLTEVTVKQFSMFANSVGLEQESNSPVPANDQTAVTGVSWVDAIRYCNWLSQQKDLPPSEWCYAKSEGGHWQLAPRWWKRSGYRLPTVHEWQSIAGPAPSWDGFGGTGHASRAWTLESTRGVVQGVGHKVRGIQGLYDVWGNAAEWCELDNGSNQRPVAGGSVATSIEVPLIPLELLDKHMRSSQIGFRVVKWYKH